jgi:hypothetical protein
MAEAAVAVAAAWQRLRKHFTILARYGGDGGNGSSSWAAVRVRQLWWQWGLWSLCPTLPTKGHHPPAPSGPVGIRKVFPARAHSPGVVVSATAASLPEDGIPTSTRESCRRALAKWVRRCYYFMRALDIIAPLPSLLSTLSSFTPSWLSSSSSPIAPLPSSSTTARRLCIGNGKDAILNPDKSNNTFATTAKMPAHWQQWHHHNEGNNASSTTARCLRIDDACKPPKPLLWASAWWISPLPRAVSPACFVTFLFRIFFILSVFSSSHPPILATRIIFHRVTTLFSWRCQKPSISRLPHCSPHFRTYRGILRMYLWYSKKKGVNGGNPRHKNTVSDQFCVATTGVFWPINVPTFGCCSYMSPTCRWLSQPRCKQHV